MEAAHVPINRWMDKEVVVYNMIMMEYYLPIKKHEILPFATEWMGLEGIMLSEVLPSEKDLYYAISPICEI